MLEDWKVIESSEVKSDWYLVSNLGNIKNIKGKSICTWKVNTGYMMCKLYKESSPKSKYLYVHRLVAQHFLPNPDNLPQVGHDDGDKTNNALMNVYWTTNKDNTQHGYDTGAYKIKSRCHKILAKCKKFDNITEYKSIRATADELGYNRKTITSLLKGNKLSNNYNHMFKYKDLEEDWC